MFGALYVATDGLEADYEEKEMVKSVASISVIIIRLVRNEIRKN